MRELSHNGPPLVDTYVSIILISAERADMPVVLDEGTGRHEVLGAVCDPAKAVERHELLTLSCERIESACNIGNKTMGCIY